MKFGMRKRSFKKSFKAKTTGKWKRKVKRATNPFYGKKGMGWIKNPKRAMYNKVYNKTSFDSRKLIRSSGGSNIITPIAKLISSIIVLMLVASLALSVFSLLLVFIAILAIGYGIYKIVIWHKNSKRYSPDQIERLSAILPPNLIGDNKQSNAKFVSSVDSYLNTLMASITTEYNNMENAPLPQFFDAYQSWIRDIAICDSIKAINAEPDKYITSQDSYAATAQINMINRTFEKELQSAMKLKTDRGKQNRYRKYFDELNTYADLILPETQERIEELKSMHLTVE